MLRITVLLFCLQLEYQCLYDIAQEAENRVENTYANVL